MNNKTYLFTKNESQFRHYVRECGINPRDAIYVSDVQCLRRGITLYLVGQWWEKYHHDEIVYWAKIAGIKVVDGLPPIPRIDDADLST